MSQTSNVVAPPRTSSNGTGSQVIESWSFGSARGDYSAPAGLSNMHLKFKVTTNYTFVATEGEEDVPDNVIISRYSAIKASGSGTNTAPSIAVDNSISDQYSQTDSSLYNNNLTLQKNRYGYVLEMREGKEDIEVVTVVEASISVAQGSKIIFDIRNAVTAPEVRLTKNTEQANVTKFMIGQIVKGATAIDGYPLNLSPLNYGSGFQQARTKLDDISWEINGNTFKSFTPGLSPNFVQQVNYLTTSDLTAREPLWSWMSKEKPRVSWVGNFYYTPPYGTLKNTNISLGQFAYRKFVDVLEPSFNFFFGTQSNRVEEGETFVNLGSIFTNSSVVNIASHGFASTLQPNPAIYLTYSSVTPSSQFCSSPGDAQYTYGNFFITQTINFLHEAFLPVTGWGNFFKNNFTGIASNDTLFSLDRRYLATSRSTATGGFAPEYADGPSVGFNANNTFIAYRGAFKAVTYLMYRAPGDSYDVPLRKATWQWNYSAAKSQANSAWTTTSNSVSSGAISIPFYHPSWFSTYVAPPPPKS